MNDLNRATARSAPGSAPIKVGQRVAVVGAGMLGMSLALRLSQAGARVTVYEASGCAGGLAEPAQFRSGAQSYTWDRFYHVVLASDLRTRGLLEELGLSDRMRWGVSRTGFYTDGRLHSMSNTLEFLRFEPLNLLDKLRLGATIFLGSRIRRAAPLEKVLAVDWLRRYSGANVLNRIWLPLLKSKLGDNYKVASAAFIWAIIARMYAARRSGLKTEMFGTIAGGYAPVLRALAEKLAANGVQILLNSPVREVTGSIGNGGKPGGVMLQSCDAPVREFDHVVMTTAPGLSARICTGLAQHEAQRLKDITYQGVVCAALLLRKPLSPYYVTNITESWVPFTGVIEMTNLVDAATFGGHSLVYLPLYLAQDDPGWQASDESIQERFISALEKMYPHFSRADVVDFSISRAPQVLAISTLDYSRTLLPPLRQSEPNIYFVNAAQIAHGTLNVNETLGLVDEHLPALVRAMGLTDGQSPAHLPAFQGAVASGTTINPMENAA